MVQTAEQYEFIHRGLCLFERTLADWSRNFRPMAAANLQQCKKKIINERGVFESFANEVDWSLMSGRQIFKRNYFSSPRTLNRCKWSRVVVLVFVPLPTNLLHCNQVAFFVHVFDVYGASVEFSFWFLQENKLFFLLSLVIEPRPVFSRVFVPMRSAYRVVTTVLMKFNCRRKKGSICRPPRCSRCVYRSSWETEASVVVCSWFPYLTLRTELSVSEFCLCRNCCFPTTTSFPSIKAESRLKATVMENVTILPKIPFQCKKKAILYPSS